MRTALVLFLLALSAPALATPCGAQSGPHTTALVELYTSEGCSSCPPAERWLSSLGAKRYAPDKVVPLSLHVDYWDYIGWKDPYAQARFSGRQRKLTQLQRLALVYTPEVMLQGREFRAWGSPSFDEALMRINAQPARARLVLQIDAAKKDALAVEALAEILEPSQRADAVLYLASYESKLSSQVSAGENKGLTLSHDYVVLEWRGPYRFDPSGKRVEKGELPLLPNAVPAHSGVAAFVQNSRTLEVLQALMLPSCRDGKG